MTTIKGHGTSKPSENNALWQCW